MSLRQKLASDISAAVRIKTANSSVLPSLANIVQQPFIKQPAKLPFYKRDIADLLGTKLTKNAWRRGRFGACCRWRATG
ncbi:MAG: hypothetical protein BWY14_01208 [Parcubacteria group bacterium ADurb.Bin192]|nr:MAG: hypothetical protein BWY14_01208 [Parcubacteria group bacterium ADurb.Bin192]